MAEWSGDRHGSWEDKVLWQLDQMRQVVVVVGAFIILGIAATILSALLG
jgi:hypothetical protein